MEKLYFAFVDTPGFFASIIRKTIGISYVHVVVALDRHLKEAYSVGRRNPSVPVIAGFEREELSKILHAFPTARYKIVSMTCSSEQKAAITETLRQCYRDRLHYHYCVIGLPFLLMGIPFYQKRHFTCSSFLAKLLSDNGIELFDKHFSLVTPRDFYELPNTMLLYEGSLATFLRLSYHSTYNKSWETAL